MLPVREETLVLGRAVERGDLKESEVPPETVSAPEGITVRFGRRLDRLVRRGQLTEQRVLQLLQEVRRASLARDQTLNPTELADATHPAREVTLLPSESGAAWRDSSGAASLPESSVTAPEPGLNQTIDGPQLEYLGPRPASQFPCENWARYEFLALLGQGGMGAVYKARDRQLGRIVALKFIRANDDQMTQRFMQEARAQSKLEHEGICRVLEVGEHAGKAYIAMQFIDGQSLDKAMSVLGLGEKVQILRDAALAMHYAHEKGVIHRDLKPANIMVARNSQGRLVPVVMDFGLAREPSEGKGLTESGTVMGTPGYMSPEQAHGDTRQLDRRSDVYSLGATLFDVLTGQAPFDDDSVVNILLKVMTEEAPTLRGRDPKLPRALDTICARCLAKDKAERYQTAQALADDLTRFLNAERITARRISLWQRLKWRARQNKPAAALLLSLLVTALGFSGYGLRARYVAQQHAALARQLGQDSKDIEWMVRTAYSLPLHNVELEQALVRKRMELVEGRLRSYGDLAGGLASYALGRGRLSLHEHKQAYKYLQQAQQRGLRSPELQAALGRVLGELYHEALVEARRSGEKSWLERRERELRAQYLEPATAALAQALSQRDALALDSLEFIASLFDFYNGRYAEADRQAQAALAAAPWLSEAIKLRGEIAHAQALRQFSQGKHDAARALLGQAIEHFQHAADISRSDGQLQAVLARAFMDLSEVDRLQGKPQDQAFAQALAAAERAITALPSDGSGYLERARVQLFIGQAAGRRKADPVPSYNQSIASAEQALARSPNDVIAWDTLGNALSWRGQWESRSSNPEPSWRRAVEAFQRAIVLSPNFPWAHNDLATCWWNHGRYLDGRGQDPRPIFQQAMDNFNRVITIDPTYQFAYVNLAGTLNDFANYSLERGIDFSPLVWKTDQHVKQCGAPCEALPSFHINMASVHISQGQLLLRQGADLRATLSQARNHIKTLLKLTKSSFLPCILSAYTDGLEAEYILASGRDPTAMAETALATASGCQALNPQAEDPWVVQAWVHQVQFTWAKEHGGQSLRFADLALRAARRAVELNPDSSDSTIEEARACIHLAAMSEPKTQSALLLEGLGAVSKLLKVRASSGTLLALRAIILKAQSRLTLDPTAQASLMQESQLSWAQALTINPLLKRQYAAELQDR
jgi:serine/threonine-protein kinase